MLIVTGCTTRPIQEESMPAQFLQIPAKPQQDHSREKSPLSASQRQDEPVVFFSAVEQSGKPEQQDVCEDLEVQNISMAIISQWDDGSKYWVVIRFINANKEDVTANLHVYAYDRLGRLVRTEFEGSVYFRQGTMLTKQYTFPKRGREVRWLLYLTGRRK
jgi:hypothetical protein